MLKLLKLFENKCFFLHHADFLNCWIGWNEGFWQDGEAFRNLLGLIFHRFPLLYSYFSGLKLCHFNSWAILSTAKHSFSLLGKFVKKFNLLWWVFVLRTTPGGKPFKTKIMITRVCYYNVKVLFRVLFRILDDLKSSI